MSETFEIGARVAWESQSASHSTRKTGQVLAVVPPEQTVEGALLVVGKNLEDFALRTTAFGMSRRHESYLVAVPPKSPRGRPTLYWPRVSHLRRKGTP